jgi:tetratricopeptide (TPR) repeat protein
MPQEPTVTGGSFLRILTFTFVAIGVLFTLDTFLESKEASEEHAEAARLFREGNQLMKQSSYADAVERFKDAVSSERNNREYRQALAESLLAAGKLEEAHTTLTDMLEEDSTDGAANLVMARVLLKEGRPTEAVSFYHRAIYGHWNTDAAANRVKVRFELVDLLTRQNSKEDLLAELLPLQEEAPNDLATSKRLGQLFIAAGSPARAADIFREVLRQTPQDPDAYAGLGAAEFSRGNYQTALTDFSAAARLNPDDESIQRKLELCSQVLTLDPTRRGLPSSERYARSLKLLELTLNETEPCTGTASPQPTKDLLDEAHKALKARVPRSRQSETYESNLDLAERLWQVRTKECAQTAPQPNQPLPLVLAKIAQ